MNTTAKRFRIGLSFSGNTRSIVEPVANNLANLLGKEAVLYDRYHEAEFARGDLAFYLPSLYREQCDLVVAIFDASYPEKEWTGLEWNAIYAMHKSRQYQSVMLLAVGPDKANGLFGLDGTANIANRSASEIAALILERLALNEGRPRDHYRSIASAGTLSAAYDGTLAITSQMFDSLRDELYLVRRDRNRVSRRRALLAFADRLDKVQQPTPAHAECLLNIWKQLIFESRYHDEYAKAAAGLEHACDKAIAMAMVPGDKWIVTRAMAEAAVDLSQTAPSAIQLNKIIALLNTTITQIGTLVGLHPESDHSHVRLSEMLATRAKCRRALATLMSRRMQSSHDISSKAKVLRHDALADATTASDADRSPFALMEQALALFANASSPTSENACAGMSIIEELATNTNNIVATYEFVRQQKLRHRYADAVNSFYPLYEIDRDRRRFSANLTLFSTSIIGLHYAGTDCSLVSSAAIDAMNWLQEAIRTENHHACDIVDYCYLLAISGMPVEKFLSPLREINNGGVIDWNVLGRRAYHVAAGNETLGDALLLGLEDASVWSRIGTLYLDFAKDFDQATVLYDQAIHIDPRSPMYHYNKARALAYGKRDFDSAKRCLAQSRRLAKYMWGWYRVNEDQFVELDRFITENIVPPAPKNET